MIRHSIRRWLILLTLVFLMPVATLPVSAAKTYTLEELLTMAETQSTPVRSLLKQYADEAVSLKILQLTYQPKLSLNAKPVNLVAEEASDRLQFQTQAGVTASIKMPFGLEASTSATLKNPFADERKLDYTFTLKYELLPGVKADSTRIQIQGKEQTLEKIAWEMKDTLKEVEIEVTDQFYSTLLSQKKLTLAEADLTDAKADLQITRELWKQGSVGEKEVLEKESVLNTRKIAVEQLRQQYRSQLNTLLTYVGIIPEQAGEEVIQLSDSSAVLKASEFKAPGTLPAVQKLAEAAIANRLGHSEPFRSLQNAKEELTRMQNLPVISAQFEYRPQSTTTVSNDKWILGINTSYAFGDARKVKLEREQKQAEIADLERQLALSRNSIQAEVETRLTNLKVAYLDYQNAELELAAARLDQTALDEQFKRGLITKLTHLSGLRNVQAKELELIQKILDYQVSYWKLQQYVYLQLEQNGVKQ